MQIVWLGQIITWLATKEPLVPTAGSLCHSRAALQPMGPRRGWHAAFHSRRSQPGAQRLHQSKGKGHSLGALPSRSLGVSPLWTLCPQVEDSIDRMGQRLTGVSLQALENVWRQVDMDQNGTLGNFLSAAVPPRAKHAGKTCLLASIERSSRSLSRSLNSPDFGEFLCLMFLWTAIGSYKTIFTLGAPLSLPPSRAAFCACIATLATCL